MHVVLAATLGKAELIKRLEAVADLTVVDDSDALQRALSAADVLVCPDHFYTAKAAAELRSGAPRLKWIQLLTAGYEHVQRHGVRQGVTVCSAGNSFSPAVAAHAVALLLALQRRVPTMLANQARHAWDRGFASVLTTPASSVVAILGFGSIGREVARLIKPFGARVIGVSRSAAPHSARRRDVRTRRSCGRAAARGRDRAVLAARPFHPSSDRRPGARPLQAQCRARQYRARRHRRFARACRGAETRHDRRRRRSTSPIRSRCRPIIRCGTRRT